MGKKLKVDDPKFSISLMEFFDEIAIKPFHEKHIAHVDVGQRIDFCGKEKEASDSYICSDCARGKFARKQSEVDYDCSHRNHIYAIRSMVCHATEISSILKGELLPENQNNFIDDFFKNKTEVNIASIGYASGTDLLAMLRYFSSKSFPIQKLNVLRIDTKAEQWQETADLTEKFIRENADLSFDFKIETLVNIDSINTKNIDVFILSYILNEVPNRTSIEKLVQNIKLIANNQFIILVNEVNKDYTPYFYDFIEIIENNMEIVNSYRDYFPFELKNGQHGYYRDYKWWCKYRDYINNNFRKFFAIKLYLQSMFYVAEYKK